MPVGLLGSVCRCVVSACACSYTVRQKKGFSHKSFKSYIIHECHTNGLSMMYDVSGVEQLLVICTYNFWYNVLLKEKPKGELCNAYPYVFRLPWLCVPVSFCTDIMQGYHFMSNSLVFCLSDKAQLVRLGWCDATLLTFDTSQISPVDQKCSIFA